VIFQINPSGSIPPINLAQRRVGRREPAQ